MDLTLADVSLFKVDVYHPPFIGAFHDTLKSAARPKHTYYSFNTGEYLVFIVFFLKITTVPPFEWTFLST